MPNVSFQKNVAGHLKSARVTPNTSLTAGGAGDNVEVQGDTIDTTGCLSIAIVIPFTATLDTAETLSLRTEVEESDDGSSFDAAVEIQAATVVATGLGTVDGAHQIADNVLQRKKFVRYNVTPDLSRGSIDTAEIAGAGVLACDVQPSTAT
jgi:hypothetical protein